MCYLFVCVQYLFYTYLKHSITDQLTMKKNSLNEEFLTQIWDKHTCTYFVSACVCKLCNSIEPIHNLCMPSERLILLTGPMHWYTCTNEKIWLVMTCTMHQIILVHVIQIFKLSTSTPINFPTLFTFVHLQLIW